MPELVIPRGCYKRANGNFPPFVLINMFLEATPAASGGYSLLSFPGLVTSSTVGVGPVVGIYRRADLFSGATFVLSSNSLVYKNGVHVGNVEAGPTYISWASSDIELVYTSGGSAFSLTAVDGAGISFPDGADVTAVTFLAGLFVFARAGSRKFYWSAVLDARTIDPLDFASAESSPSYIRDLLAIGDILYIGCSDKIEAWYPTGDGTLPFQRISQRTVARGVVATGCMVELDNALHFIGDDRVVYRMSDVPERISDHGIEEQIVTSTTFRLFRYLFEGHAFLCVRLDDKTLCFDVVTREWHERQTWDVSNWAANCAAEQADGTAIFGSATGPELLVYSGWAEGASPLSREFTAAVPSSRAIQLPSVELEANPGTAPLSAGSLPQIEMRASRDGGNTWSAWRAANLGASGKYRKRPKWKRLGSFDAPGALLQFRCTDPVPLRVSSALSGESSAGRARE